MSYTHSIVAFRSAHPQRSAPLVVVHIVWFDVSGHWERVKHLHQQAAPCESKQCGGDRPLAGGVAQRIHVNDGCCCNRHRERSVYLQFIIFLKENLFKRRFHKKKIALPWPSALELVLACYVENGRQTSKYLRTSVNITYCEIKLNFNSTTIL